MEDVIKFLVGIAGAIITYLFGGFDLSMQFLIILMITDYITGIITAYQLKQLCSSVGLKGIIKKCGYLVAVTIANMTDVLTTSTGIIRGMVIYFLIANEALSVLENLGKLGVPIPNKLKSAIMKLKQTGDSTNEEA